MLSLQWLGNRKSLISKFLFQFGLTEHRRDLPQSVQSTSNVHNFHKRNHDQYNDKPGSGPGPGSKDLDSSPRSRSWTSCTYLLCLTRSESCQSPSKTQALQLLSENTSQPDLKHQQSPKSQSTIVLKSETFDRFQHVTESKPAKTPPQDISQPQRISPPALDHQTLAELNADVDRFFCELEDELGIWLSSDGRREHWMRSGTCEGARTLVA